MDISNLFPTDAGVYLAQRDTDLVLLRIRGLYPTLQLDKGMDLARCIRSNKNAEATKEMMSNIKLFPEKWTFKKLNCNYSVFSKPNEFQPDGELTLQPDELISIKSKYLRMCQQGVPSSQVIQALVYEFKVNTETVIKLINHLDKSWQ